MKFKHWIENTENSLRAGEWHTLNGVGYTVQVSQYSNKGPVFIINQQNQEVGRAYFDLFSMSWKPSN